MGRAAQLAQIGRGNLRRNCPGYICREGSGKLSWCDWEKCPRKNVRAELSGEAWLNTQEDTQTNRQLLTGYTISLTR